jgi:sugar transferase EpsL
VPWERRFALDVWYVEHQSCRLDARILLRTVWKAAAQADVSEPGESSDGFSTWPSAR